jgi:lipoate-protein ligase B
MIAQVLGTLLYREAWAIQESVHAEVLAGAEERLLLVEHPPVITFGRRAEIEGQKNLVASEDSLKKLGVELVQSDRGGDITFHGPGQIVAYPIVRLNDHRLSVGGYVRKLEETVISAMHTFGVEARRIQGCVGIWVGQEKLCAIGVRIRRGVSLHGVALNVETDLRYFDLIVPCGLTGKSVTSMRMLLGEHTPSIDSVKQILSAHFVRAFA